MSVRWWSEKADCYMGYFGGCLRGCDCWSNRCGHTLYKEVLVSAMNLLPGLYEAFRLMALNDLDFAPGIIMKRIEELEGEVVKPVNVTGDLRLDMIRELKSDNQRLKCEVESLRRELVIANGYFDLMNQSVVKVRDLTSELSQRDEQLRVALDEVRQWKESTQAVALASKEVENELKVALGECVVAMKDCRIYEGTHVISRLIKPAITHAQALLNK